MLGEPHLRILQSLDQPKTPTELAEELGYSVKHVSQTLSRLAEIGLATKEREGGRNIYRTTENRAVESYRELTSRHPHVNFPELLTPSYLCVVFHLDEARTADELTKMSKPSRATVYRILKELRNRGVVRTEDDGYVVRDPYIPLTEFAREAVLLEHGSTLRGDFPGAKSHIVWNNDYEFIASLRKTSDTEDEIKERTTESDGRYYLTGLEVLEDYDLRFLTISGYHVFYTEDTKKIDTASAESRLPPEDIVCHVAIIQDRSSLDQRYTLLFLAKLRDELGVQEASFKQRAVHYGISRKMDALLDYLDAKDERKTQDDEDLPVWDEFQRLAREYEVTV